MLTKAKYAKKKKIPLKFLRHYKTGMHKGADFIHFRYHGTIQWPGLEGRSKITSFQTHCHELGHLPLDHVGQSPNPTWPGYYSKSGETTTFLGSLFQCFITPTIKNFFLVFNLNLPSSTLKSLSLVLSLHVLSSFLVGPFRYWKVLSSHPEPCLLLNIPSSLSLFS